MGLDFSHGNARFSYSGFNRFRTRVAAAIGVYLPAMEGFRKEGVITDLFGVVPIKWSSVKDPLVPFLDHSDCDGSLTPDECRSVANRLRELFTGDDEVSMLLESLDAAAAAGEPLEFR